MIEKRPILGPTNLSINIAVREAMKIQAVKEDRFFWELYQEAAINYLTSKGVQVELRYEDDAQADNIGSPAINVDGNSENHTDGSKKIESDVSTQTGSTQNVPRETDTKPAVILPTQNVPRETKTITPEVPGKPQPPKPMIL